MNSQSSFSLKSLRQGAPTPGRPGNVRFQPSVGSSVTSTSTQAQRTSQPTASRPSGSTNHSFSHVQLPARPITVRPGLFVPNKPSDAPVMKSSHSQPSLPAEPPMTSNVNLEERLKKALEDKEEAENFLENMEFQLAEMQADRQRLELQVESSEQQLKQQYEQFDGMVRELEDKLQHATQELESAQRASHEHQSALHATEQKLAVALADLQRSQAEAAKAHRDLLAAQQLVQQQADQLARLHEAERRAASVDQRVAGVEERAQRREADVRALRDKMRAAQSGWEAWYQKAMQAEQALVQQMEQLKQRAENAESELMYMQTESAVTINLLQTEREKERTLTQQLEAAQSRVENLQHQLGHTAAAADPESWFQSLSDRIERLATRIEELKQAVDVDGIETVEAALQELHADFQAMLERPADEIVQLVDRLLLESRLRIVEQDFAELTSEDGDAARDGDAEPPLQQALDHSVRQATHLEQQLRQHMLNFAEHQTTTHSNPSSSASKPMVRSGASSPPAVEMYVDHTNKLQALCSALREKLHTLQPDSAASATSKPVLTSSSSAPSSLSSSSSSSSFHLSIPPLDGLCKSAESLSPSVLDPNSATNALLTPDFLTTLAKVAAAFSTPTSNQKKSATSSSVSSVHYVPPLPLSPLKSPQSGGGASNSVDVKTNVLLLDAFLALRAQHLKLVTLSSSSSSSPADSESVAKLQSELTTLRAQHDSLLTQMSSLRGAHRDGAEMNMRLSQQWELERERNDKLWQQLQDAQARCKELEGGQSSSSSSSPAPVLELVVDTKVVDALQLELRQTRELLHAVQQKYNALWQSAQAVPFYKRDDKQAVAQAVLEAESTHLRLEVSQLLAELREEQQRLASERALTARLTEVSQQQSADSLKLTQRVSALEQRCAAEHARVQAWADKYARGQRRWQLLTEEVHRAEDQLRTLPWELMFFGDDEDEEHIRNAAAAGLSVGRVAPSSSSVPLALELDLLNTSSASNAPRTPLKLTSSDQSLSAEIIDSSPSDMLYSSPPSPVAARSSLNAFDSSLFAPATSSMSEAPPSAFSPSAAASSSHHHAFAQSLPVGALAPARRLPSSSSPTSSNSSSNPSSLPSSHSSSLTAEDASRLGPAPLVTSSSAISYDAPLSPEHFSSPASSLRGSRQNALDHSSSSQRVTIQSLDDDLLTNIDDSIPKSPAARSRMVSFTSPSFQSPYALATSASTDRLLSPTTYPSPPPVDEQAEPVSKLDELIVALHVDIQRRATRVSTAVRHAQDAERRLGDECNAFKQQLTAAQESMAAQADEKQRQYIRLQTTQQQLRRMETEQAEWLAARNQFQAQADRLTALQAAHQVALQQLREVQQQLQSTQRVAATSTSATARVSELEAEVDRLASAIGHKQGELDACQAELQQLRDKLAQKEEDIHAVEQQLQQVDQQVLEFEAECRVKEETLNQQLQAAQGELAASHQRAQMVLLKERQSFQKEREQWLSEREKLEAKILEAQQRVDELQQQVDEQSKASAQQHNAASDSESKTQSMNADGPTTSASAAPIPSSTSGSLSEDSLPIVTPRPSSPSARFVPSSVSHSTAPSATLQSNLRKSIRELEQQIRLMQSVADKQQVSAKQQQARQQIERMRGMVAQLQAQLHSSSSSSSLSSSSS